MNTLKFEMNLIARSAFILFGIVLLILFAVFSPAIAQTAVGTPTTPTYCLSSLSSVQKVPEVDSIQKQTIIQTDGAGYTWRETHGNETVFNEAEFVPSSTASKAPEVPELYDRQCPFWSYFLDECFTQYRVMPIYSAAAKVLFINGYPRTLLGMASPEAYALVGDEKTRLPSSHRLSTRYMGEAPNLGAAILRGPNDELLLYGATGLKELPLGLAPRRDGFSSWRTVMDRGTKRVFIRNNDFGDSKAFLFEVVEGPTLRKIGLDSSLQGWPTIFSLPGDRQEWIITRYGIYAEIDGEFRPVALIKKPEYIKGPAGIGFTKERELYFEIHSDTDKSKTRPLALTRKDLSQKCAQELDLGKTIEIESR
jgi:hypothetical protein